MTTAEHTTNPPEQPQPACALLDARRLYLILPLPHSITYALDGCRPGQHVTPHRGCFLR